MRRAREPQRKAPTMSRGEQELADTIKLLVDAPEAVEVDEYASGDEVSFEVRVDPDDLGKVIGRQGRTVRALRNLLEARGKRDGTRYRLDIIED